ncbi:recombination protein O N-terminal domain-containing protein [Spiroplasma citri]|uniref:Recombination protein O N-terminal domain-containing protein n=1 Tax=Spiroplasma citri TaxID=2133 RepID=A0AAX3SZY5_SPICI|nr:recombination protein O N-terminal domain-containing protein [Spiroplasma citri]WFG96901.1 recombination protein O N-terminal domain-containing protein [Spiroplasma citri]WFH00799.1 recombination protein O N-terminal domain-containing protein [Spiroplasma citri]
MAQKLTGIVFNKQPYDDNSAIVTILSKELGKLAFLPWSTKNYIKKSVCSTILSNKWV